MSHWVTTDVHPDPAILGEDASSGRRPKVLYWWPSPVSADRSAEVGRRMLVGTILWMIMLIPVLFVIAALFEAAG